MIHQILHVIVICDRCYDRLTDEDTDPGGAAPVWFAGRKDALDALADALDSGGGGWVRLFDGRLLCPACTAAQTCRDRRHDYAPDGWRMCACQRSIPAHADAPPDPASGDGYGITWRLCGRCDHIDKHPITDHPDEPEPAASETASGPAASETASGPAASGPVEAITDRPEHGFDLTDGYCRTHRAYCSQAQVQPGGHLRQDVPAGLALPTHTPTRPRTSGHETSREAPMVEPITTPRAATGAGVGGAR